MKKIGNHRRFLLIKELQSNPSTNLKELSIKLRIKYSTAKTIVQTFRREKRFMTREKIIINSKREEKLCKKNLYLLGKKRVNFLTSNILNEYNVIPSMNFLDSLKANESMKLELNAKQISPDPNPLGASYIPPLGIASNSFNGHKLEMINPSCSDSFEKKESSNTMLSNLIIKNALQTEYTKSLKKNYQDEICKTEIEENNHKRSIGTTTNDLLFFSPLGDIFYIIDEDEGLLEYNKEIDFNNLVHLRKKLDNTHEIKPDCSPRKLPPIDCYIDPYVISQSPILPNMMNINCRAKFNFSPYKQKIIYDYYRRKNLTPYLCKIKNENAYLPIPGPLYIKDLLNREMKIIELMNFQMK